MFLPDYYALIPECVGALQEREDALEAVHLLLEQLREKQEAAGKLAPGDKRAGALAASVTALQVSVRRASGSASQPHASHTHAHPLCVCRTSCWRRSSSTSCSGSATRRS